MFYRNNLISFLFHYFGYFGYSHKGELRFIRLSGKKSIQQLFLLPPSRPPRSNLTETVRDFDRVGTLRNYDEAHNRFFWICSMLHKHILPHLKLQVLLCSNTLDMRRTVPLSSTCRQHRQSKLEHQYRTVFQLYDNLGRHLHMPASLEGCVWCLFVSHEPPIYGQ